jgi:uncharacterized protein YdhG (YjbR/CyaY superfamily)
VQPAGASQRGRGPEPLIWLKWQVTGRAAPGCQTGHYVYRVPGRWCDGSGDVKSAAASVRSYIDEQPQEWQPTLKQLRALCPRELRGFSEDMAYRMPSYSRAGQVEVGFGKQARYLSLYILKQPVLDAHRKQLAGISTGKGCIRYRRPDQIDWAVVTSLLSDTDASEAEIC